MLVHGMWHGCDHGVHVPILTNCDASHPNTAAPASVYITSPSQHGAQTDVGARLAATSSAAGALVLLVWEAAWAIVHSDASSGHPLAVLLAAACGVDVRQREEWVGWWVGRGKEGAKAKEWSKRGESGWGGVRGSNGSSDRQQAALQCCWGWACGRTCGGLYFWTPALPCMRTCPYRAFALPCLIRDA